MPYVGKSPTANGVRNRFYFTQSSSGATSISGSDDNGKTLTFTDAAYVDVLLNGSSLVSGTDYVATPSTNTLGSITALVQNDVVEVVVYDVFIRFRKLYAVLLQVLRKFLWTFFVVGGQKRVTPNAP